MKSKVSAIPTIFPSLNARSLTPEEVARSFVPSPMFYDLYERSHTLLVGPRGSGKTSMLKMLQPTALGTWNDPQADEIRKVVDYSGIFIPTDKNWNTQLMALGEGKLEPSVKNSLTKASFATHVLQAFVDSMTYRVDSWTDDSNSSAHRPVNFTNDQTTSLVEELCDAWNLTTSVRSLPSLRISLSKRMQSIFNIAEQLSFLEHKEQKAAIIKHEFIHNNFLTLVSTGIIIFNEAAGQRDARWALLFDELEIAPDWVLESILQSLRSIDQHIIIKCSISPFDEKLENLTSAVSAMPHHDYKEIALWYSHKESGFPFTKDLLLRILTEGQSADLDINDIFGSSEFESPRINYAPNKSGNRKDRLKEIIEDDASVKAYFNELGLDHETASNLKDNERAALLRKIYPNLIVRHHFRKEEITTSGAKRNYKSISNPRIYAGSSGILAMLEANPRWIIGFAKEIRNTINTNKKRISEAQQMGVIQKIASRFRSQLKTIPCDWGTGGRGDVLLGLLDKIGEYFKHEFIIEDFRAEPHLTFSVDSHTTPQLEASIGLALNAGAIVYIPDKEASSYIQSVKGKRFRFSYILCPTYKIPIRLGAQISLAKILENKQNDATSEQQELGEF